LSACRVLSSRRSEPRSSGAPHARYSIYEPATKARIFAGLVGLGFLVLTISSVLLGHATTQQSSFGTFVVPLVLSGVGLVTLFLLLSIAVLGATTPTEGPKAGAFLNLAMQLGGSVSVAAPSVFVDRRETFHSTILGG
jgi:hypothetical protein